MAADVGPSLADDEAALARYSDQLVTAVGHVAEPWLKRLVERQAPGLTKESGVEDQLAAAAAGAVAELRGLLQRDIADQPTGPLDVLRRAVRVPTQILTQAGIEQHGRDPFAVRNFPDDVYNLSPASFADVDQSLHEPGLMWGAAKAHVHLRRRRENQPVTQPSADNNIVVLSVDLMDRSKISAAFPSAKIVRSVDALLEHARSASLVVVDLARVDDIAALAALQGFDARFIAFGSHVDEASLQLASQVGAEAIPRSVFFRRLAAGEL